MDSITRTGYEGILLYIFKCTLAAALTLVLIVAVTFILMNAVPGNPFMAEKSTPDQIALANAKYGLGKPL